ncbi:MAG TPA: hypothetical protein PLF28_11235 [Agitococcus sp.]|nr:hypothetical protein [Agitococcus sp.]
MMIKSSKSPICCSENDKTLEVNFSEEYIGQKNRIDDVLIKDQTIKKCDFSVRLYTKNAHKKQVLVYVELKGSNVGRAVEQLESTIQILNDNKDFKGFPVQQAHAVCSRIPRGDTIRQTATSKFLKRYNFDLKFHSQKGTVSFS